MKVPLDSSKERETSLSLLHQVHCLFMFEFVFVCSVNPYIINVFSCENCKIALQLKYF